MAERRTSRWRATSAAVAAVAVFAGACGSDTADTSVRDAPTTAPVGESAPADTGDTSDAVDPGSAGSTPPDGAEDIEYGRLFEDWEQNVHERRATQGAVEDAIEASPGYTPISWWDLIPEGQSGEEIRARYQDRLDVAEGEERSALFEQMQAEYNPEAVNPNLDGQKIRMAGFVAPLTYDGDTITEFLLVPTFGACIHVPPPPPNQTVVVTGHQAKGISFEESWGAVWVEGTMSVTATTTDLAPAGYTITDVTTGVYT